jgi:hypothetical protein
MGYHPDRPDVGTRPALLTGIAYASFLTGAVIAIAGVVNIFHLHDTAGGTFGVFLGSVFLLAGRYIWRLHGRPTVESTSEGIVFHADVDPIMRLLTGKRTVTFRWENIEILDFQRTPSGWTIWLILDGGPERGERLIPIAFPSDDAMAALVADMRRKSNGKRPHKPTQWLERGVPI